MKTKQTKQLAQIIQSLYVLAVVSGLPLGQRAWGLPGDLLLTIHNPTPVADDWFGYSVAAVGTNLLVGAPMKDSGAANAGAVYLFNGKTGDLLLSIYNPFPGQGDLFGWSVAGAGDNILVGAPYNDAGWTDSGSAYLFNGTTGALMLSMDNPTSATSDCFGWSVSGVGNNLLIGAPYDDTGATNAGSAYLFNGSTGALMLTIKNPAPAAGDYFGYSVSHLGNNLLVGAPYDNLGGTDSGNAYVFNGSTGAKLLTIKNPTPFSNDQFGFSVGEVSGNILVGAPRDDTGATDSGSIHLFDGTTGVLIRTLSNPTPAMADFFGGAVAGPDGAIVAGADSDDTGASGAGSAYLYDGAIGALRLTLNNPQPDAVEFFGWAVAGVEANILVGAPYDNAGASSAGAAYLYCGITGPCSVPNAAEDWELYD